MTSSKPLSVGQRLLRERLRLNWSQQHLAEAVGASVMSISRWERDLSYPQPHYRERLCAVLGTSSDVLFGTDTNDASKSTVFHHNTVPGIYDPALPLPLNKRHHLVGREELIEKLVASLCADSASFAFTGLPGIGKTALVTALAHHARIHRHFQDGILWAGLGPNPPMLELMNRWGTLLGLTATEMSNLITLDDWARHLHDRIASRRMLLIIDDAWQLSEAITFRLGGYNCTHLLTTRFPAIAWAFAPEHTQHLYELGEDDSVALLEQVAPLAAKGRFSAQIQALARSVGGLPLSLTLIGRSLQVQAQSLQPRRIEMALQRLLQDAEERLQVAEPQVPWEQAPNLPIGASLSLQTAIEMSDRHLSKQAQTALRALSIFPPKPHSFSENAAIAVCNMSVEILDLLMDSGMLESHSPGRYQLHQTVADYARLRRSDPEVETRFVAFFVEFINTHQHDSEILEQEVQNILAAFEVAFTHTWSDLLYRGVLAFAPFMETRRLFALADDWLPRARQAGLALADLERVAYTWFYSGRMAELRGDYPQARQSYYEGLALARQVGKEKLLGHLLILAGGVLLQQSDFEQAEIYLEEGLAIAQAQNDREYLSLAFKNLGEIADSMGDGQKRDAYYRQGLALAREMGHWEMASALLQDLGSAAVFRGDYEQAAIYYQEGMEYAQRYNNLQRQCAIWLNRGMLAFHQSQHTQAISFTLESLHLARMIGNRMRISSALQNLAMLERILGNEAQAEIYLQESMDLAREIGDRCLICESYGEWGALYLRQQKLSMARDSFQMMLAEAKDAGLQPLIAPALFGLAQVEASSGNLQAALSYGQESQTLFEHLDDVRGRSVAEWLTSLTAEQEK